MPYAPPRLCPKGHAPFTGSRCPMCSRDHDAARGSAARRGYGRTWQGIRAEVLKEQPRCVRCGAPATDVDHIDGNPRNNVGHNLRALCHSCHSRRTLRDQTPMGARGGRGSGF